MLVLRAWTNDSNVAAEVFGRRHGHTGILSGWIQRNLPRYTRNFEHHCPLETVTELVLDGSHVDWFLSCTHHTGRSCRASAHLLWILKLWCWGMETFSGRRTTEQWSK